jgi:hypothetical protein
MSQHHAGTVPLQEAEQGIEGQKPERTEGDLGHDAKTTKLSRISQIATNLQFAECERYIEDELLEASLEQYQ